MITQREEDDLLLSKKDAIDVCSCVGLKDLLCKCCCCLLSLDVSPLIKQSDDSIC